MTGFKVGAAPLANGLQRAAAALPPFAVAVLSPSAGGVDVDGRGGDIASVRTHVECDDPPGRASAFHIPQVLGWLKRRGDATVNIEADGMSLLFTAGRSRLSVITVPEADIPTWDTIEGAAPVRVPGLWAAMVRCSRVASTDTTRPMLTGVELTPQGVTGADLYRLSHVNAPGATQAAIVPAGTIRQVDKWATGEPVVAVTDLHIVIDDGTSVWYTRPIGRDYPKWGPLIGDPPRTAAFNRTELVAAVEDCLPAVMLRLAVNPDGATVTADVAEAQQVETELPVETVETIEFGFNPGFLLEALTATETAAIRFTDAQKPVLLEDEHGFELLLPMRLD